MIGILVLTTGETGQHLIDEASSIRNETPNQILSLAAHHRAPEKMMTLIGESLQALDQGDGVLILADIYGATHTNTACSLLQPGRIELVTGVNLAMLIRVLNYRHLDLDQLAEKAAEGGRECVVWRNVPPDLKEMKG
jgi:PTS system mannose-specific IIA component